MSENAPVFLSLSPVPSWASRFSEEQIIGMLMELGVGAVQSELCHRNGISGTSFYKWKSKNDGLEVSDAKRLRSLEDETARLKKLLADTMPDNVVLKDLAAKTGDT